MSSCTTQTNSFGYFPSHIFQFCFRIKQVYFGENSTTYYPDYEDLLPTYTYAFYWSTLTLAMMGDVPHPTTVVEYCFVVTEFLVAVLVFATIIGNVGNIISSMNAERDKFQETMDGVKRYMVLRRVNKDLERRVIRSAAITIISLVPIGIRYCTYISLQAPTS
jgi:Ion transport protein